jgi:hypothetical protein
VQGGARAGDGLFVDCIAPIMRGFARPRRSNKPLPQIDGQLVADCKAQNPNFGQRTTLPSQASEPSARVSPLPQAASPQLAPAGQRNGPPSESVEPPMHCSAPAARDSANGPCAAAQ